MLTMGVELGYQRTSNTRSLSDALFDSPTCPPNIDVLLRTKMKKFILLPSKKSRTMLRCQINRLNKTDPEEPNNRIGFIIGWFDQWTTTALKNPENSLKRWTVPSLIKNQIIFRCSRAVDEKTAAQKPKKVKFWLPSPLSFFVISPKLQNVGNVVFTNGQSEKFFTKIIYLLIFRTLSDDFRKIKNPQNGLFVFEWRIAC